MNIPSSSDVSSSARHFGRECLAVFPRRSAHGVHGVVVVAVFRSFRAGSNFARAWAQRNQYQIFVRRAADGWAVSVPVARSIGGCAASGRGLWPTIAGGK